MPLGKLGEAEVDVRINNDEVDKDMEGTETKVKGKFGKIGSVAGGLLKAGIIGGVAAGIAGIGALVGKYRELNEELRPAANRIGVTTAELQSLRKVADILGSEDGLEGVTDSIQELSLRMQDMTKDGYRADVALTQLGLSGDKLREMSPADAMLETLSALQQVEDQQKKNWLADELFGGQWENIAGVVNASNDEFAALLESQSKNEESMQRVLDSSVELDKIVDKAKTTFEGFALQGLEVVMPLLIQFADLIETKVGPFLTGVGHILSSDVNPTFAALAKAWREDILPLLKELGELLGPVLIPIFEGVVAFIGGPVIQHFQVLLVSALKILKGALMVIVGLLSGDFDQAWRGMAMIAEGVINAVLSGAELLVKGLTGAINAIINKAADALEKIPLMKAKADALRGKILGDVNFGRANFTAGLPTTQRITTSSAGDIQVGGGVPGSGGGSGNITVINVNNPVNLDETGWTEKIATAKRLGDRLDYTTESP